MFIGHLPAGYLVFRTVHRRSLLWAGCLGAVAPDLDMLAFHFWHERAFHHHEYLTHRPLFWAAVLVLALCLKHMALPRVMAWVAVFACGAILHCGLDTIAGSIGWLWPFSDAATTLVMIPPTYEHWVYSFLFH